MWQRMLSVAIATTLLAPSVIEAQTLAPPAAPLAAPAEASAIPASDYVGATGPGVTPTTHAPNTQPTIDELMRRIAQNEAEIAALRGKRTTPAAYVNQPSTANNQLQDEPSFPAIYERLRNLENLLQAPIPGQSLLFSLTGFFQLDDGLFDQSAVNTATLGPVQNGIGFRRARLQSFGKLSEFTSYTMEFDFATVGRPSFMDLWVQQSNLPFFGNVRVGQFRMPVTMDSWTSVRHLEFLERSTPFQALDPFRRVGAMAWCNSEDERSLLAYSVYGTGLTFWNGSGTSYSTFGDNRSGTQLGNNGVSTSIRGTHLLYYDEPANGRYLLHVGGGYNYSQIGGFGQSGSEAQTYESRTIPEFFVGDPAAGGATAGGTPFVLDTGRILASNYHLWHTELAGNYGPAHFQTEVLLTQLNQLHGPPVYYGGTYLQGGYFLTGENAGYNKQVGVLDYNVKPFTEFFGLGRRKRMCGWGAWELTARWSYLDLSATNILAANQLGGTPGIPVSPNPGSLNESTVGLNWWWNQYTRVQFNWIRAMLDSNVTGSSTMDIYATRFQIEF
ncbi:MAG: hypothetical protein JSS27_06430 [Planctomycetes bacterium]|nr:hypothetical protein [Planctomycetota bacterium]